jgi:DNA-binding transcriptional ArsR family regulator
VREIAEVPSSGDADLAALGSLFADPARCKVLLALDDGRALPASVLADEAGVSRPTASSHLMKLTAAGLLAVESHGRHRYYRLAGPQVGELLEQLVRLAPPGRSVHCAREHRRRGCAGRGPVMTTWRAGSASQSWPACWTAAC